MVLYYKSENRITADWTTGFVFPIEIYFSALLFAERLWDPTGFLSCGYQYT
jgi:hypothetical protein